MINSKEASRLDIEKEIKNYTDRLNFLRSESLRLEGVVLYLQNLLQQDSQNQV